MYRTARFLPARKRCCVVEFGEQVVPVQTVR